MTDEQKTCGGCVWFHKESEECECPKSVATIYRCYAREGADATDCPIFRSHADAALIADCHRKRSLGYAIPWSDVDRLVELLAGKPLERRKRCEKCNGEGQFPSIFAAVGSIECDACNGTGHKRGDT